MHQERGSSTVRFQGFLHAVHSSRKSTVSLSSCEAELYAAVMGATYGVYAISLLREILDKSFVVRLMADSTSAQALVERQGMGRNRHLDLRVCFLQKAVTSKQVVVSRVSTTENLSDLGTK